MEIQYILFLVNVTYQDDKERKKWQKIVTSPIPEFQNGRIPPEHGDLTIEIACTKAKTEVTQSHPQFTCADLGAEIVSLQLIS